MISKKRLKILSALILIDITILTIAVLAVERTLSFVEWIPFLLLYLLLIVLWVLYLYSSRCPYCHRRGLRFRWKDTDAGYCNYCGKLVEFKEHQDE